MHALVISYSYIFGVPHNGTYYQCIKCRIKHALCHICLLSRTQYFKVQTGLYFSHQQRAEQRFQEHNPLPLLWMCCRLQTGKGACTTFKESKSSSINNTPTTTYPTATCPTTITTTTATGRTRTATAPTTTTAAA